MKNIPDLKGKDVLIIGPPASGKTYLAGKLSQRGHITLHSDEFIEKYGYAEALYELMNTLKEISGPVIIEGTLGYRLLRKGAELNCFSPDVVIEIQVPTERIAKTYAEQRPGKNFTSVLTSMKANATVLRDYQAMSVEKKPLWVKLENNY